MTDKDILLQYVDVIITSEKGICITFYEFDSEWNGDDFEYYYNLDSENAELFLKQIPHVDEDEKTNIQEWLVNNVRCDGIGLDMLDKWIEMGLHGSERVWEDYPGGVSYTKEF